MHVFISYARDDIEPARRLYADLTAMGLEPWMDEKDIRGGQRWESAIQAAIEKCKYFVALISSRSVDKRGYVQKEVRKALELLDRVPELQVFLIPVRLDECKPTIGKLSELNWVDLFPDWNEGVAKSLLAMELEGDGRAGNDVMEILKRVYLEADGDEDKMLKAIQGLKGHVDRTSIKVTDKEWEYLQRMCPSSVVDLLKTYCGGGTASVEKDGKGKGPADRRHATKTTDKVKKSTK